MSVQRKMGWAILCTTLMLAACSAPTQPSGGINTVAASDQASSPTATGLIQADNGPEGEETSPPTERTPLIEHIAEELPPSPPMYVFDIEKSLLLRFSAETANPTRFPMAAPYQFHVHPSPEDQRVAYLGGDLTLDPGLELVVLRSSDGVENVRIPILAPGWQRSNEAGDIPEGDPVAAITEPDAMTWSPDGDQLAFVGAIERFAAELYILDISTETVSRVTELPYAPAMPAWSPDGTQLAFVLVRSFGTGAGWSTAGIGIAQAESGEWDIFTSSDGLRVQRWLTEDSVLLSHWDLNWGMHDLGILNTESGEIAWYFEGPLHAEAIPTTGGPIALLTQPEGSSSNGSFGVYVVSAERPAQMCLPLEDERLYLLEWSPALNLFVVSITNETVFFTPNCELITSIPTEGRTRLSPDGAWTASLSQQGDSLVLISLLHAEEQRWDEFPLAELHWLPDSSGLLLLTPERELYVMRLDTATGAMLLPPERLSSDALIFIQP